MSSWPGNTRYTCHGHRVPAGYQGPSTAVPCFTVNGPVLVAGYPGYLAGINPTAAGESDVRLFRVSGQPV
eukprot:2347950-Rhodomonas_salina.3